ncbi:hypothetical protein Bhyg_04140 [Pseudolycoriella hygida]|uniref:Uncharacterized protein n=1 Tax=Pseudolycoriella hygida TaxID=35572 RepID=A0A9Q0S9D2_9DIPT|nr:hypothetical protein Bhyg_04140 [Pseudolycoriella hygida]
MEREKYFKECIDNRKLNQNNQRVENIRTIYENMSERMKESPHNVVVAKEQVAAAPQKHFNLKTMENRHKDESQQYLKRNPEGMSHILRFGGKTSNSEESISYYHSNEQRKNEYESVDLTKDNDVSIPIVRQVRYDRSEQGTDYAEINRNKRPSNSDAQLEHGIPAKVQHKDFDFSIPFNESNILIKVMAPEVRKPVTQSSSLLQETLQGAGEPKQEINAQKRVLCDDESKANPIRVESGFGNQWIQYIQNILKKNCDPEKEHLSKKVSTEQQKTKIKSTEAPTTSQSIETMPTMPKNFVEQRISHIPSPIRKPSNTGVPTIPSRTNYYDTSSSRLRLDRPIVQNPRIVRPKVVHPSPYFRPDILRNEQMEDPMVAPAPVPRQSTDHVQDSPSIPHHMEYLYGNHLNYHTDFNVARGIRFPVEGPHANLMGQPVYSPYDPAYVQYRSDIDRMTHPCIDSYMQHNLHVPPLNPNLGYLPPRPTAPGMYRYLNPQLIHHPFWIYPHMLER